MAMDGKTLDSEKQRLLRPSEAAKSLGISLRKLYSENKSGKLPSVRIGRCLRYRPADLDAYVDSLAVEGRL